MSDQRFGQVLSDQMRRDHLEYEKRQNLRHRQLMDALMSLRTHLTHTEEPKRG